MTDYEKRRDEVAKSQALSLWDNLSFEEMSEGTRALCEEREALYRMGSDWCRDTYAKELEAEIESLKSVPPGKCRYTDECSEGYEERIEEREKEIEKWKRVASVQSAKLQEAVEVLYRGAEYGLSKFPCIEALAKIAAMSEPSTEEKKCQK